MKKVIENVNNGGRGGGWSVCVIDGEITFVLNLQSKLKQLSKFNGFY